MTKIDTKEIRSKYGKMIVQQDEHFTIAVNNPDIIELCDAYDEAQKEVGLLKGAMRADEILSSKQRISTLEALLKKVLALDDGTKFFKYKNDLLLFCPLCFAPDGCHEDCLSWEIKKELGEG